MEIELKLAVEQDPLRVIEDELLPRLKKDASVKVTRSEKNLFNAYYDTPDQLLGQRKIGFRVRNSGESFEQTVKTQGQVIGGLHQRPEYNLVLADSKPDLTKFDRDIWGEDFDIQAVNQSLEQLFETNFVRVQFDIAFADGVVELVLDRGTVSTAESSTQIHELELELKQGDAHLLFDLAEHIQDLIPVRLSDVTKASRGYQLLKNIPPKVKPLPKYLALNRDDTTEDGFCKALSCALSHWQYHQALYLQNEDSRALWEVRESLLLLLQCVSLYLPVLQSDALLELHKNLLVLVQQWSWQEDIKSIRQLRSKKGPFSKRIPKNPQLINYLLGRREGLFLAYRPHALLMSALSSKVQISASRLMVEKPWRTQIDGADIPVLKHANGWLSQSWQTVIQSLPSNASMDAIKYLSLEVLLKQSLINGFLLADLFIDTRGHFRAPWLDLMQGIEELKAIDFLKDALKECEIEELDEFNEWLAEKSQSLISVMERSLKVAMNAEVYW
ncbi:inorganic triphosphatase [Ningiella sp. W23]|uniref:CYTH domain-containing protein n=1 Tax=Ningiella sp. W23 TaxID=3023715 RepID=UPI00375648FC